MTSKTDVATMCRKCHNPVLVTHAYRVSGMGPIVMGSTTVAGGVVHWVEHLNCDSPEAPERLARTVPLNNSRY